MARAAGGWRLHYDPAIAAPFASAMQGEGLDLWPWYEQIRCPTLVLRGAQSDLLTAQTVAQMQARGPKAHSVTFPGIGHAPTLRAPDQIAAVLGFLQSA